MVQREWSGSGNWKDHLNGSNPEEKEAEPTHTHTHNPGWQVNCVNITSCCREEKERPTVCLIIKDLMSFHFSEWNDWKQQQSVNNVTQRRVSSGAHQDRTVCSNIYFCLYFTLVFTPFFYTVTSDCPMPALYFTIMPLNPEKALWISALLKCTTQMNCLAVLLPGSCFPFV